MKTIFIAVGAFALNSMTPGSYAAEPVPIVIPGIKGSSTTTKFGDGCITRTSDGKTYTTTRFGSGWITRGPNGETFTTSKFGNGAITRGPASETITTSKFGSGTISRSNEGTTTTTSRFGSGTITRTGAQTTRIQPFGRGVISTSNSNKNPAVLVIQPQTAGSKCGSR